MHFEDFELYVCIMVKKIVASLNDILTSEVLHWEGNWILLFPKPNNRDFNAIVPISLEVQRISNSISESTHVLVAEKHHLVQIRDLRTEP